MLNSNTDYNFSSDTEVDKTCYISGQSLLEFLGLAEGKGNLLITMYYMNSKVYETNKNKFYFLPLNNSTNTDIYKQWQLKVPMQYTGANASLF